MRHARVNDRFRRDGWLPSTCRSRDNFPQSVAAYKQYDVLLVNPVFDGLNLVSKEAPLVNERDGVLILSENAGSHEELGEWALTVNPFDVAGQAEAIHAALTMAVDERRRRLEAIRACVREHDLAAWIAAQLADLDACSLGRTITLMATTAAPELVSVNPATLEPVGSVRRTDPDELPGIVAASRAAQAPLVGARAAGARERSARDGTRPARARGRDRRLDRRRDGEAASPRRSRTSSTRRSIMRRGSRSTAPRVLADERVRFSQLHLKTKKAWLAVRAARRRRRDHAVEHPVRRSRSPRWRPRSLPETASC